MTHVAKEDLASELRAEIARRKVKIFKIAPIVDMHPTSLGQLLRGNRPLSPELAERIRQAIVVVAEWPTPSR
jgi:plasmid maintenance system antidote protein VapI